MSAWCTPARAISVTSFCALLWVAGCGNPEVQQTSTVMESRRVTVDSCDLHYLEVTPPVHAGVNPDQPGRNAQRQTVVLLHGARFSAETWRELGTLEVLADAGFRVLALDLPRFGKSTGEPPFDRAGFLAKALIQLNAVPCALLSPSMSGGYALPYLLQHPDRISHFLPVAPVGIQNNLEGLAKVSVPTLALWGENDQVIPLDLGRLLVQTMPNAELRVFADAPHPCYLQATEEFHSAVIDFMAADSFEAYPGLSPQGAAWAAGKG